MQRMVQQQVSLILHLERSRLTLMQSMIQCMKWQGTKLDMVKLSRDFLTDTLVKEEFENKQNDKTHELFLVGFIIELFYLKNVIKWKYEYQ